jgi:hypothetical protein
VIFIAEGDGGNDAADLFRNIFCLVEQSEAEPADFGVRS